MHGLWTNDPTRRGRRRRPWHQPRAARPPRRHGGHHRPHHRGHSSREACAPGAPGPAGPRSGADREGPVSSPSSSTTTLDGALRPGPRPGRCADPTAGLRGGSSLVHQLLLALVCAGYAARCGARLGLARSRPVHGRLRPQRRGGRRRRVLLPLRPQPSGPLPPGLAAVRALLGHGGRSATWSGAGTRSCSGRAVPSPRYADLFFLLLRAARHRRACWCSPSARSPGPAGSAWGWTPG